MKIDCIPQLPHIRFPPASDCHFDLIILGAGCTGLSLAYRLSTNPCFEGRVLLVDSRIEYHRDRSWCFFSPEDASLVPEELISHRWSTVVVRSGAESIRLTLDSKPYVYVDASVFYQRAFGRIKDDPRFSIALGYSISDEDLVVQDEGISLRIDHKLYTSGQVLDSRSDRSHIKSSAQLWQVFIGYEIEADSPCFWPEEVTLMDFIESEEYIVSFMYELPLTPFKALLEYTVFSESSIDPECLLPLLKKVISDRFEGNNYRITRTEKGVIPMGLDDLPQHTHKRWHKAGLLAGISRASTGYAFLRIQRWARYCSETFSSNEILEATLKDPAITSIMDKVFLGALKRMPSQTTRIFLELFKNTPSLSLARFLNDEGRMLDHIYVLRSLSRLSLMRELLKGRQD